MVSLWLQCVARLQDELPFTEFSMWIRPLQAERTENALVLYAPNQFVLDWVREKYLSSLQKSLIEFAGDQAPTVAFAVGSRPGAVETAATTRSSHPDAATTPSSVAAHQTLGLQEAVPHTYSDLNQKYHFLSFVEGKSNQLAGAAAVQVSEAPGEAYNPLFLYGGTGLGKTHLLHAIGNGILADKPSAKVAYIHSERFVQGMVKAFQTHSIEKFKAQFRTLDTLLIDDIQFFAKKERSQEEFLHTLNILLEAGHQVVLTSDRYPKDIAGIEERLKSRFASGLTVAIEPPDFEMRVAILLKKAEENRIMLSVEVASFIAKRLYGNVRELEGALNCVVAHANFSGRIITLEFVKEALKDFLLLQEKLMTVENIQKLVADYYRLKQTDLLSQKRTRSVARPRQLAMALSKELTNHSLPEIGAAFGGRDHTTVLHACRKIQELCEESYTVQQDFFYLKRALAR